MDNVVVSIVIGALPILLAITVHEAAHGYAARHFGDMTAERMGRISLNPFRHIDPFGTIILPAMTILLGGILFGWAKPVPVNFRNLRHPKQDMLWVAAAGPMSNLVMAIIWAMLLRTSPHLPAYIGQFLALTSQVGITINIVLMVINLVPIPPLDGGRIMVSLLPMHLAIKFQRLEQYSLWILIGFFILLTQTPLGSMVVAPIIRFFEMMIVRFFV
ncbi:MAG TPA: site-2 protease family protein [Methylophilus sp.]|nr:site-2 protease family protein [Methylophilus sp.]HQQ33958.1 site-2 protease family protein [Methylophilus sp.]